MIVKKLIEKIEGEAELDFVFDQGKIEDVKISFGFYRGIEEILSGKDPLDALVITPRVCGICNHAHLLAAVHALESGYKRAGINAEPSQKAKDIRDFTLSCELMQNHMKWFYMTVVPRLEKLLNETNRDNHALKASYFSSTITKALAIFGGQWPHSSYAVPGGVTCDPTYVDIMQAESLVDEFIRFFEHVVIGISLEEYFTIEEAYHLDKLQGDFGRVLNLIGIHGLSRAGQSHDRFIVLGESILSGSGKANATRISKVDPLFVREHLQTGSTSKAVTYKERLFEVGPLSRAMVAKRPVVKSLHKKYKDSLLTRIFARVHEAALLMYRNKEILRNMRLDEPSCTFRSDIKVKTTHGIGVVEAARGSLIHKTSIKEGKIDRYEIIVPTQWNLSHGNSTEKGIAVEAMTGCGTIEEATFVFRTFDVCSVCTTQ